MVSIFLDEQDVNLSGINYSENFKICFFFFSFDNFKVGLSPFPKLVLFASMKAL